MRSASVLLLALTSLLLACPKQEPTVLLGEIGSLTGSEATFGISTQRGIALAVAEANADGGIRGVKLALRVYDDQGRADEAANAATRLINQDHAVAILGEAASSNSMAIADRAQAFKTPQVSPSSTNPAYTEKGDYIFRVCFIDPFQGEVMARFAHDQLMLKHVAVLVDVKSAYSLGLAEVFTRKFEELGGHIDGRESYGKGDSDFRSQLTRVKGSHPEALFVPGYYSDVAVMARQKRELGMTVPMLGGDGWDSAELFKLAGGALEGSYFSNHYSSEDPNPDVQDFLKRYRAAYSAEPESVSVLGYDAANLVIDALRRAKDTSGPALRDEIANGGEARGVGGAFRLDAHRNAIRPAVVLKIEGKHAKFVTRLGP